MPTKKPSAKASKAKKTVSLKSTPAKKRVPTKAHAKPAAKAAKAPASAKSAAVKKKAVTSVSKSTAKPAAPAAKTTSKKAVATVAPKVPSAQAANMTAHSPVRLSGKSSSGAAAVSTPFAKMTPPKPASLSAANAKHVAVAERRKPLVAPTDDEDGESGTNLLAGPRNVTPYQAKRGEQYMNKEQMDHFRYILASWKQDLMHEVDRTVLHMKDEAANFPDPNDRATQESEFSLELRTRDRERKLIRKIDEAIARIDDGSYGYCNETGEEIGIKRLEARPVATLCVEAQERRERRERQYGDRDDRYR